MAKETYKNIEIKGRKFRLNKFDAFTGSYIIYTLMEKMMPLFMEQMAKVDGENMQNKLPVNRKPMSKEEFKSFQLDCLSACQEVLPAGNTNVINENGSFGVLGLEQDSGLVIRLTIESLVFNVTSFFADGGLGSIMEMMPGIQSQNSQT